MHLIRRVLAMLPVPQTFASEAKGQERSPQPQSAGPDAARDHADLLASLVPSGEVIDLASYRNQRRRA